MRARRSERVKRLSCSIALSILGVPRTTLAALAASAPGALHSALTYPAVGSAGWPGQRLRLRGLFSVAFSVWVSEIARQTTEKTPATFASRALPAPRLFPLGLAQPSGNRSPEPEYPSGATLVLHWYYPSLWQCPSPGRAVCEENDAKSGHTLKFLERLFGCQHALSCGLPKLHGSP